MKKQYVLNITTIYAMLVAFATLMITACPEPEKPITKTQPTKDTNTGSFTITFNLDGGTGNDGTPTIKDQTIALDKKATKPTAPTKDTFNFGEWYQDKEFTIPFFFDMPITQDISLYARWNNPNEFTVRFNPNGGSVIKDKIIAKDGTVTRPLPTKIDSPRTFIDWYTDSAPTSASTPFKFTTPITENTIIYAGWGYAVTFNLDSGTGDDGTNLPKTIWGFVPVLTGSMVPKPTDPPTKTDAAFGGWYKDKELLTPFFFTTEKITKTIILYAKWNKPNEFTVQFNPNDGTLAIKDQTIALGEKATKPENPTKTGAAFGAWHKDSKLTTVFDFTTDTITDSITLYAGWGSIWRTVTGGQISTVGIKTDNTLWAWGFNWNGQLGFGDKRSRYVPTQIGTATWKAVSIGGNLVDAPTVGIQTDGTLWAWGWNKYGQLGLGKSGGIEQRPMQVGSDKDWSTVDAGEDHTVGIKTDGTLWAWGRNSYGSLGTGNTTQYTRPTQVGSDKWKAVAAGDAHTVGIKTDGTLWTWGMNRYGQLGFGVYKGKKQRPTQVGSDKDWSTISAGQLHTGGMKTNGTLWTWGWNAFGQLGVKSEIRVNDCGGRGRTCFRTSRPTQVGSDTWKAFDMEHNNTVGIKTDDTLWVWGNNVYGQVANGRSGWGEEKHRPTQVGSDTWKAANAGMRHTVGIKTDGSLWAWGWNKYGQVGNNRKNEKELRPTAIIVPPAK